MGFLPKPKTWIPYVNTKDCSKGFCSKYCPQWCYIIFPPPPPIEFPDDNSGPNFSPFVIAIIGVLATAFLLVSCYAIISKYCGNGHAARRRESQVTSDQELEGNQEDPSNYEPWHVCDNGLDEALIKAITICKYKKGDGLIDGTDCSVCLSEFQEDENLRLLPKCSHAFHVTCIDTWLRSHSNCPLCRANIFFINSAPHPLPSAVAESTTNNEFSLQSQNDNNNDNAAAEEDIEVGVREEIPSSEVVNVAKYPIRALSDLGNSVEGDTIMDINGEDQQHIRRSVSMDYSCQSRFSVADILQINQEEYFHVEEDNNLHNEIGSSKRAAVAETSKASCRHKTLQLHCVLGHVAMKRSFSSGRFLFARHGTGRERNVTILL